MRCRTLENMATVCAAAVVKLVEVQDAVPAMALA